MNVTSASGISPVPTFLLSYSPVGSRHPEHKPAWADGGEKVSQLHSNDFPSSEQQSARSLEAPDLGCFASSRKRVLDSTPSSLSVTYVSLLESLSFFCLSSKCNPWRVDWREGEGVEERGQLVFRSVRALTSKLWQDRPPWTPGKHVSAAAPCVL